MRFLVLPIAMALACSTPKLADRPLPDTPADLAAAFAQMPAPAHARVRVLDDNIDAWLARINTIESAQRTLDVQYFIIEPDAYGMALLGLLAEKARAGVKVRLMVDARGSIELIRSGQRFMLQELKHAGADVRVYNPMLWQLGETIARGDMRAVVASNHDKLIIADGQIVVAGGRNISKDYMSDPNDQANAFIDMDVLYESPTTAARMTEAFVAEFEAPRCSPLWTGAGGDGRTALRLALEAMQRWIAAAPFTEGELAELSSGQVGERKRADLALALEGQLVGEEKKIPGDEVRSALRKATENLARGARLRGGRQRTTVVVADDEVDLHVLDTHSAEGREVKNTVNENLMLAVLGAKKSLLIQSPYFVLTERGIRALEQVSAHGVPITILTNSPASSDSPATQAAFLKQWPSLLARVPTARLFVVAEGRLMHAKVGVVDDQVAFIGSYNLDPLSAGVNGEVVGALWSERIAHHVTELVNARIAEGQPNVVEYRLQRDDKGNAVINDGEPVIAYGADDHCSAEQLKSARKLQPMLEMLTPLL